MRLNLSISSSRGWIRSQEQPPCLFCPLQNLRVREPGRRVLPVTRKPPRRRPVNDTNNLVSTKKDVETCQVAMRQNWGGIHRFVEINQLPKLCEQSRVGMRFLRRLVGSAVSQLQMEVFDSVKGSRSNSMPLDLVRHKLSGHQAIRGMQAWEQARIHIDHIM